MWRTVTIIVPFSKLCGRKQSGSRVIRSAAVYPFNICVGRCSSSSTMSEEGEQQGEPPPGFSEITEGRAKILFPSTNEVFYNPVQEFNRDLSTLVINHFTKKIWESDWRKRKSKQVLKTGGTQEIGASVKEGMGEEEKEGECDNQEQSEEELTSNLSDQNCNKSTEELQEEDSTGEVNVRVDEVVGAESTSDHKEMENSNQPVRGVSVLEALAASGLRSIRYALEVPAVTHVMANDYSPEAYENICRNIDYNTVKDKVIPSCKEASMLMYEHKDPLKQFTVIDLDPYGSPSTFLDPAVQAVSDGGLLCITCTDASILCGNHPETCYSKYGSVSLKLKCCHEMGVRIILSSLESHANRYKRYIVPLLSCSIDFYMRVFAQVFTSAAQVKRSLSKRSMVYACSKCESYHLQPLGKCLEDASSKKYPAANGPPVDRRCEQCGSTFKLGGPIWSAPMHDAEFVHDLLNEVNVHSQDYYTSARIKGLLTVISEELQDVPLHYVLDQICNTLHCNMPNMLALRSAIMEQGYRVSISHTSANAIKTDAPNSVLWDIMRCWVKQSPVKLKPNTPAAAILSKEPQIDACFSVRKDANPPSRLQKLSRFPENPEANWGPKARAKRKAAVEKENESSKRVKVQDEISE